MSLLETTSKMPILSSTVHTHSTLEDSEQGHVLTKGRSRAYLRQPTGPVPNHKVYVYAHVSIRAVDLLVGISESAYELLS